LLAKKKIKASVAAAKLERSPAFALEEEGEARFFVHRGGRRIRTDFLGQAIWKALPGPRPDVLSKISRHGSIPREMAVDFLDILVRAEIVLASGGLPRKKVDCRLPAQKKPAGSSSLVSVVVVTHCGEKHIRSCLSSLLSQSYAPLEIIVVDNACRDRTPEIVAREFSGVTLVRSRKNLQYAGGINFGLRRARGEHVFFLNDDTEVDPACVELLIKRLERDERAAAAIPIMRFYDLRPFVNGLGNHVKGKGWGSDNYIGAVDLGTFHDLVEVSSACFGAALIRKKALEDVGPLDEGYQAFYEDVDWSFRARRRGWRIVPESRAVVYHKFGASWKLRPEKLRFVVRNRLRLVLKTFDGKTRSDYLKSYIKEDIKALVSLMRKKDWRRALAYPASYLGLTASLPKMLWLRARLRRGKDPSFDGSALPGPREPYPVLIDDEGNPRLDAGAYFRHYVWELSRRGGR